MSRTVSMLRRLLTASLLLPLSAHGVQTGGVTHRRFAIGHVYFYGYAGLDWKQVEQHLPVQAGESLPLEILVGREEALIRHVVDTETGRPATDIAWVCCDESHRLLLYIGLSGTSYRRLHFRQPPSGNEHLDPTAVRLYRDDIARLSKATVLGDSREDDSKGYALSNDSAARHTELEMRAYAANRGHQIERVLDNSASQQQREVSSCLLGYAHPSAAQIDSLLRASTDPDGTVRNNAVRALWVLFSSHESSPPDLNISPLIDLLWSGTWTDRNKSSELLAALTRDRNPEILQRLRESAMPPLLEGARWDPGHADAFLLILGRMASIPQARLNAMLANHKAEEIVAAAETTTHRNELP